MFANVELGDDGDDGDDGDGGDDDGDNDGDDDGADGAHEEGQTKDPLVSNPLLTDSSRVCLF